MREIKWIKATLCLFLLFSSVARSAPVGTVGWSELEVKRAYGLSDPLVLSPKLTLPKGTQVMLTEISPLDEIGVQLFQLQLNLCTPETSTVTTDMILDQEIYGVQLEPHCVIKIYLETPDLVRKSFFNQEG